MTVNPCLQSTMFNQKFVLPLQPPASALLQTLHQFSLNVYRFPVRVAASWQTTHAPTSPSSAWSPKSLSDRDIQHYELPAPLFSAHTELLDFPPMCLILARLCLYTCCSLLGPSFLSTSVTSTSSSVNSRMSISSGKSSGLSQIEERAGSSVPSTTSSGLLSHGLDLSLRASPPNYTVNSLMISLWTSSFTS